MGSYTKSEHIKDLNRSIKQAKKIGLKMDVSIIGNYCCSECDKIDKTTFPFENLLQNSVLPHINCTRKPFCICCYGFHPLRDERGRLIQKKY